MNAESIVTAINENTFTSAELSRIFIALHTKLNPPRPLSLGAPLSSRFDFIIGQRVSFGRPNGRKQTGTLKKRNEKTVKVLCDQDGKMWNVSYSLLTKLEG